MSALRSLLDGITEEDATVLAESLFLKYPNAVKDVRALPRSRLELYNLIASGVDSPDEIERVTSLKKNNIWTQIKILLDDGYLVKVPVKDRAARYRIATTDDILGGSD